MKTRLLIHRLIAMSALLIASAIVSDAIAQAPDFTLTMEPSAVTLIPGKSAAFVVSLTPLNGFSNSVTLATGALPDGVEASFSPNPLTPPGISVLTLRAATNAATGLFPLEITARGGGITNTASTSVTVNFGLLPLCYGAFRGVVTDIETGQPVPDADVFASYSYTTRTSADAGGHYGFTNLALAPDNLPAQYTLWASRTDYWASAYTYSYAVCDVTNEVNLLLVQKRYGMISGTVTDPDNNPLANVTVSISGPVSASLDTDSNGAFQSGDLGLGQNNAPAYYSVVGRTNFYWQGSTNTTVAAGSNSVVHLVLIPICYLTVTGSVVYADTGLPAANRNVTLYHPAGNRAVLTDLNGNYVFTNTTLNYYNETANCSLQSSAAGYYTAYTNLTLTTCGETVTAPTLLLQPLPQHYYASLQGHVYDVETSLAISNAVVTLSQQTRTDTLGAYSLTNIDLGTASSNFFYLYVSSDKYFVTSTNIWLFAGQVSTQDVTMLLIRYGVVAGTVVDSATHLPIANAQVSVPGFNQTGPDGKYQSQPIPLSPGNQPRYVGWYASANGYWSLSTNTTLTADHTNYIDIELIKVCTAANVLGIVVDAVTQQPITGARVQTYDAQANYRVSYTDTNGAFALTNLTVGNNNSPSQISLTASAQGYNPQTKSLTIFCGANIITEFGQPQTVFGAIEGYVTNAVTGLPLTNVFVGSEFGAAAVTDTNGYYTFAQVPLGPNGAERIWQITAMPAGFPQQAQSVLVSSNQVSRLDFGFGQPTTDLAVTLTAVPDPVTVSSNLAYTLVLRNYGGDAANVVLSDQLPSGVDFVRASITNSPGLAFTGPALADGIVTTSTTNMPADATATLTVVVRPITVGTLTNRVSVATDTQDTIPDNNTASVITSVNPPPVLPADLAISLTGTPDHVTISNQLTYVVTVTNLGPENVSGVAVTDLLPSSVHLVSVTPGQGGWIQGTNSFTWAVGPLPSGSGASLTAVVIPGATGLITNTATVEMAGPTQDPNPANNTASVTTSVTLPAVMEADLAISLVATPNLVAVSNMLTYLVSVTNSGPENVSEVVVTDLLPPSVHLVSVAPGQGSWTEGAGSFTWAVGPLAHGSGAALTAVVIPAVTGVITNTVTVQIAEGVPTQDPNPTNNTATATTLVTTPNEVEVVTPLVLNRQTGLFEQTIRVTNTGEDTLPALRVLINGPNTNFVVYNASGTTPEGIPFVLFNQALAPGAQVDFVLEYYLQDRVPLGQPAFSVEAVPSVPPLEAEGTVLDLDRAPLMAQGRVLIEFGTTPGRRYAVQFSSDSQTWKTAVPPLTAAGTRIQWFDDGPPKTDSRPPDANSRFYRVVQLPEN